MLQSVKKLMKTHLTALDGSIGRVEDFYFENSSWAFRYVVADISSWLVDRRVLLSPAALSAPDERGIAVNCTKEQIRRSPDVGADPPLSRKMERELHDYYSWPYYWYYPNHYNSLGAAMYPGLTYPVDSGRPLLEEPLTPMSQEEKRRIDEQTKGAHLRSSADMLGYAVWASSKEAGEIEDFIVDYEKWVVRYLAVKKNEQSALVAANWISKIDWSEAGAAVDISYELIRSAPQYVSGMLIDREYEERLYSHYGRSGYWT